jgi:Lipase (class 3)
MATTPNLALLALRVYSTPLASNPNPLIRDTEWNRPAVPTGWIELEWHADQGDGFSYGVYRNGTEIVIAYAGTNQGIDWASNAAIGLGLGSTQVTKASIAYLQAQQQYGSNITFTGHSLGGGLASIMAVWFDRPAVVFDEGPFEATALKPLIMGAVAASLGLTGIAVPSEFLSFIASYPLVYGQRESQVVNDYLQGEALGNRVTFAVEGSWERRRACVRQTGSTPNRYVLNSCLRSIPLGYRLIRYKNKLCLRVKRIRLRTTTACSEVRV